ncbi:MAG: hypothetical protein AMXMBFR56_51780 [Polyangiaceae bacterium]
MRLTHGGVSSILAPLSGPMANAKPLSLDFKSCDELDPELIERAFAPGTSSPREQVLKLLDKMARVAKPGRGAHRILEVLARLSHGAWVEGALDIVLRDFGLATEIDIRVDVGKHFERLRTISVAVPLAELADWATANPEALAPLVVFDTRRDDELRLRKAQGRVTHVPLSAVPHSRPPATPSVPAMVAPVPASESPVSSARRPIAAASRRKSVPPRPAASTDSKRSAELHARRTLPDVEQQAPDVHRRNTPRVLKVDLPEEAYRSKPGPPERKSTARIPAVRPPQAPAASDPDPTDEGWE